MRVLLAALLLVAACGSDPKDKDDAPAPADSPEGLRLAEGGTFGATFDWASGPRTCTDESLQSAGTLTILTADGNTPKTVADVSITPWMKIHGHGTGRWQPGWALRAGTINQFDVTGICFIMAGPWELNIDATVDGRAGSLEWTVEVP